VLRLVHQDANQPIIAKPIDNAHHNTASVFTLQEVFDVAFRAPDGCEVELICSERLLRDTAELIFRRFSNVDAKLKSFDEILQGERLLAGVVAPHLQVVHRVLGDDHVELLPVGGVAKHFRVLLAVGVVGLREQRLVGGRDRVGPVGVELRQPEAIDVRLVADDDPGQRGEGRRDRGRVPRERILLGVGERSRRAAELRNRDVRLQPGEKGTLGRPRAQVHDADRRRRRQRARGEQGGRC